MHPIADTDHTHPTVQETLDDLERDGLVIKGDDERYRITELGIEKYSGYSTVLSHPSSMTTRLALRLRAPLNRYLEQHDRVKWHQQNAARLATLNLEQHISGDGDIPF